MIGLAREERARREKEGNRKGRETGRRDAGIQMEMGHCQRRDNVSVTSRPRSWRPRRERKLSGRIVIVPPGIRDEKASRTGQISRFSGIEEANREPGRKTSGRTTPQRRSEDATATARIHVRNRASLSLSFEKESSRRQHGEHAIDRETCSHDGCPRLATSPMT